MNNTHSVQGFTLLEMIGVMAVMAILAGALAPAVFQMIEDGYQTAEEQSLETIGGALQEVLRRERRLPTETLADWSQTVADYAAIPAAKVSTNDKNFTRRLYVDPMFFSATNQAFPGFNQTSGLNSAPVSPRLMIVSNLNANVTTNITTNASFTDVWEQTGTAVLVESDTLLIQRVNLANEFSEVLLSNANTALAGYELDGGTENSVAAGSGLVDGQRSIVVVSGTRLSLNAAPFPGGSTLRQAVVRNSSGYRYEFDGAVWVWTD